MQDITCVVYNSEHGRYNMLPTMCTYIGNGEATVDSLLMRIYGWGMKPDTVHDIFLTILSLILKGDNVILPGLLVSFPNLANICEHVRSLPTDEEIAKWALTSLQSLSQGKSYEVHPYRFITRSSEVRDIEVFVRMGFSPRNPVHYEDIKHVATTRMDIFDYKLHVKQWAALIRHGLDLRDLFAYVCIDMNLCCESICKDVFLQNFLSNSAYRSYTFTKPICGKSWMHGLVSAIDEYTVRRQLIIVMKELSIHPSHGTFPGGYEVREASSHFGGKDYTLSVGNITDLDSAIRIAAELGIIRFKDKSGLVSLLQTRSREILDSLPYATRLHDLCKVCKVFNITFISCDISNIHQHISMQIRERYALLSCEMEWKELLSLYSSLFIPVPSTVEEWRIYFKEYLSQL